MCVCSGKNFSQGLGCIHTKRIHTLSIHKSNPVTQNTVSRRSTYGRTEKDKLEQMWKKLQAVTEVISWYLPGGTEEDINIADDDWDMNWTSDYNIAIPTCLVISD
jgi:hypothetical protein